MVTGGRYVVASPFTKNPTSGSAAMEAFVCQHILVLSGAAGN